MNTLATVVNLIGRAWAVAADGTRRELNIGDRLRGDEMLVTEPGARVDLDFGNNQQLTFLGEQQQVIAEAAQSVPDQLPTSSPRTVADERTQPESGAQRGLGEPEGHNFVQLVRIQEIIEADGITPLTVARIQEVLRPLGMSLPERVYELDEWREHRGGEQRHESGWIDNVPPSLVQTLPPQLDEDSGPVDLDLGSYFTDNSPNLSYKVEGLPPGLSYDPSTGRITGTIDKSGSQGGPGGDGNYPITVTVTDPAGNSTTTTFTWTVTNPPPVANDDSQTIDEDTTATGNLITGTNNTGTGGGPDHDPDGDELKVTEFTVDGTTYQPGQTATITDADGPVGTITIGDNGNYIFTPVQDWNGTVPDIGYTITDGEGGTSSAKLTITVTPVNDPPVAVGTIGDRENEDDEPITTVKLDLPNLFKDVDGDELTYSINGLPEGLTFDPVTGEITGTIDNSASQNGPNKDGKHEVVLTATDPDGETTTQTFIWTVKNPEPEAKNDSGETLKSTRLTVDADGGVLQNDNDPDGDDLFVQGVVSGSGTTETAEGVGTAINGDYGTLILQPDGSYVYTPNLHNNDVWELSEGSTLTDTFTYTISDGEGGTATAVLEITIKGHSNTPPFLTPEDHNDEGDTAIAGQVTVYEKGLSQGSEPGEGHKAAGVIQISALDGLASVTIGSSTFDLSALEGLSSGVPLGPITVPGGTLILTGFEPILGTYFADDPADRVEKTLGGDLHYTYELTDEQTHADADGNNSLLLDIQLGVKDDQNANSLDANNKLVVNVIDDMPAANDIDAGSLVEDGAVTKLEGDVTDAATGNIFGADGQHATDAVSWGSGVTATLHGNSVNLSDYGSLSQDSDGKWSFTLDNAKLATQALNDNDQIVVTMPYTLQDKDSDTAEAEVIFVITGANDGVIVTVPDPIDPNDPNYPTVADPQNPNDPARGKVGDLVVFESGLSNGSHPDNDDITVKSSFTISALDGLADTDALILSVGSEELKLSKSQIEELDSTSSNVLTTKYGELQLTGYAQDPNTGVITIEYEYTLTKAPDNNSDPDYTDEHAFDKITITAKDRDGDDDEQTLSIKIIDDAPLAEDDANSVTEDGSETSTASGNVIGTGGATDPSGDDEADTTGADAAKVTEIQLGTDPDTKTQVTEGGVQIKGQYGTLTIQPDGSYTYELDNSNLDVQALNGTEGADDQLKDVFTYILTDGDGDSDDAKLTITITGSNDEVTITVPNPGDPNDPQNPPDETAYPDAPQGSNITDLVVFESGLPAGSEGDGTDAVENLVTVKSSFTISALDGLADTDALILNVGAKEIRLGKSDIEYLGTTPSAELETSYGKLKLTGYTPNADGTITIDYEYTLTSAPNNTDTGYTDEHAFDHITITAKDRDVDSATQTLSIKIIDDAPKIAVEGEKVGSLTVDETNFDNDGQVTATNAEFVKEVFDVTQGADGATTTYSLEVTDGTDSGLKDTATGQNIYLYQNGDAVEGRVGSPTDVAFKIEINANTGAVTLTQQRPVQHPDKTNPDDPVTLNADSIKLYATATDGDEDEVKSAGVSVGGKFTFKDDGPTLDNTDIDNGVFTDNATVHEKHLPSGSDSDTPALTVIKELPINYGSDGAVNSEGKTGLVFTDTNITDLQALNLTSGAAALSYELSTDGHTITAKAGSSDIFEITLSVDAGTPSYSFTLKGPLDHRLVMDGQDETYPDIELPFSIIATDGDGDSVALDFKVLVTDDTPLAVDRVLDVVEDGSVSFSNADVNKTTTKLKEGAGPEHGTVTIGDDGTITYEPTTDYRGEDSFTYTVTVAGSAYERTVNITVNPVADDPLFVNSNDEPVAAYDYKVETPEDTEISLSLKLPVIKDKGGQGEGEPGYDDYSELLGAITLTPSGAGYISGQTAEADNTRFFTTINGTETKLSPDSDGKITIVIVGDDGEPLSDYHVSDIKTLHPESDAGTYYLTEAEYQAITAHPAEDRHENFEVEVKVTSYEVDELGKKLDGVAGAPNTQTITVDVQAVTDNVGIEFADPSDDGWKGENSDAVLTVVDKDTASITLNEDSSFNLTSILIAGHKDEEGQVAGSFKDTDSSETRYLAFENLPTGTTFTDENGVELSLTQATIGEGADERVIYYLPPLTGTAGSLPEVNMHMPKDFSGDLTDIKVIIGAQDSDSDSPDHNPGLVIDEVTLNLYVKPVAGDVNEASSHETEEDTAVAFLSDIKVTDTSRDSTGGEVITSVEFSLPTDENVSWSLTGQPADTSGWSMTGTGTGPYIITFDDTLDQEARELVLGQFQVTPPGHSSLDAEDWVIKVTTVDRQEVGGTTVPSDPVTVAHRVTITVTPVAETTVLDSNKTGGMDVTINEPHIYATVGYEDEWFKLGVEDDFNLKTGWNNEDTDEYTYARLTPELVETSGKDANAIGSMFRYSSDSGTTWHEFTYAGEPSNIWIPMEHLDTLEFKGKENFSGSFSIKVEAVTVDYDDDNEPTTHPWDPANPNTSILSADHNGASVKVSGSALLTNVVIQGVADDITLALNGHARGKEDEAINLDITAISSDASERIELTISDIPVGATIYYTADDGSRVPFTSEAGKTSLTLKDFNGLDSDYSRLPLEFKAPEHKDGNFTLKVSAKSSEKDRDGDDVIEDLTINISVEGVADDAVVIPVGGATFTEAELEDDGPSTVTLSDLFNVTTPDTDGSEVVTVRISGLPEGFKLSGVGATLVQTGTGGERIWTLKQEDLDEITIDTPPNYSGTVTFQVAGVTTEKGDWGGDSKTMPPVDVSFTVTPSPDATTTTEATLVEDEITLLDLKIVYQNGDTDETLGEVFIPVDYASGAGVNFTLYLGDAELSSASLRVESIGGVDYYVIPADRVEELGALGAEHLDKALGSFDFKYDVIDGHYGSTPSGTPVTATKDGTFTLNATPVTDKITVSIDNIQGTPGSTTVTDEYTGDDANPDTATLTASDTVTVNLKVNSEDTDGSEHLIRVLIEGVPVGVTVEGGQQIDTNNWVLVYEGTNAQSIGASLDVPVTFVTGPDVSSGNYPITMTVQAKDRGNDPAANTRIEEDQVTWHLDIKYDGEGELALPTVDQWEYNGSGATEDTQFKLADIVTAEVSTNEAGRSHTLTVTLTEVPEGTEIEGMTRTVRNGTEIWTASVTVAPGGDADVALAGLLDSIQITAPENKNDNNNPGGFKFNASLSASVAGGGSDAKTIDKDVMVIPVTPETDPANITVTVDNVDEGSNEIPVTITVNTGEDGIYGKIVDGQVYVKVETTGGVNDGMLTLVGGATLTSTMIDSETYYIVPVAESGETLDLVYTPASGTSLQPGDVTFTVRANTQEQGATNTVTQSVADTATVELVNNGVTVGSNPITADEVADASLSNAIELTGTGGLSVTLNDDDNSESISAVMLSGLPNGFLVYVGESEDEAVQALSNNAGGDGTTNTWVLSSTGTLPNYVAILPPAHWSGTLADLKLIVESGELDLTESLTESFDLAGITIEAVADGVDLDATRSFGKEGDVIALNLNASMKDPDLATAAGDDSVETTSLKLTGLGQYAEFFIDGVHLAHGVDGRTVTYSGGDGTYTITGLSQEDLNKLGFKQARAALVDQDGGVAGIQIGVEAWTVESGNSVESAHATDTLTLNISSQIATTGNDTLIWTGQSINGRGGDDTIQLRFNENVTGEQLATNLRNIEIIDLGVEGANSINSLSIEDVFAMTDGDNILKIIGDGDDSVTLEGDWGVGVEADGFTTYSVTHNGSEVKLEVQQSILID